MVKQFAVKARNVPERHLAQPHCFVEQRIEHRREVARRGIDYLQDFGDRGLLLQDSRSSLCSRAFSSAVARCC